MGFFQPDLPMRSGAGSSEDDTSFSNRYLPLRPLWLQKQIPGRVSGSKVLEYVDSLGGAEARAFLQKSSHEP